MNVPTMSKSTLMSIRMTILFSEKLRMARATVPGTSSMVMMFPNRVAMAISTIMTAEVSQDSMHELIRHLKSISLYRNRPTIRP